MPNPHMTRLLSLMADDHLDFVALNPGFNLKYISGLDFHLMERPVVLIIRQDGKSAMVLPHLEVSKTEKADLNAQLFPYDDNPANWLSAFQHACKFLNIQTEKIGLEPAQIRYLEYDFLKNASPRAEIMPAGELFSKLRLIKDHHEIEKMRKAAEIAEKALLNTLPLIKIGMSEQEIASELVLQCLRAGAEGELPFQPIVASGPNSADPHAVPSTRKITAADILLFDWGVRYEGYASDITRCFAVQHADSEMSKVADIVLKANSAGRAAGRPGIRAGDVDEATRRLIADAGYGPYFTHRTGHGLGMDAHEAPYIFNENDLELQAGMVYTVEPGIYLPGKGGIRIEDDIVVTESGCTSLTTMERALQVIA